MQSKRELRRLVMDRLRALPQDTIYAWSYEITRRVCALEAFQQADTVCVFISMPGEVDTQPLIQACHTAGKKTAAPRIKDGVMDFFLFASEEELKPGFYGIREPVGNDPPEGQVLIIMPGVVFDKERRRIGHGGGYYDKYLALHPDVSTAAVAFDLQVMERIPYEPHDIRPQQVVTEKKNIEKRPY